MRAVKSLSELAYILSLDMVRFTLFAAFVLLSAFWALNDLKG